MVALLLRNLGRVAPLRSAALRRALCSSAATDILHSTNNLQSWRESNASSFAPPICNKLMHKADLSVMAVGGPNTRTDFHLEAGAEFFWQLEGDMELPIVERGRRRLVQIRQGEVFLLPPRLPVNIRAAQNTRTTTRNDSPRPVRALSLSL